MPLLARACAKQLTVNTDGPNCCRNRGEHLYGGDLMYPIAIILLSHMETIPIVCTENKYTGQKIEVHRF